MIKTYYVLIQKGYLNVTFDLFHKQKKLPSMAQRMRAICASGLHIT